MGLLDRLLGRDPQPTAQRPQAPAPQPAPSADEQAVERYRYLLRTAPPDQVEAAHAEAFAQLTPEQRQQVLTQLGDAVPAAERPTGDDPQQLARAATRAEVRRPGTLERSFSGGGPMGGRGGPGFGSMVGASLLGTVAGVVVGTAVADALFDTGVGDGGLFGGGEEAYADGGGDVSGGDVSGGDVGGGDFGGEDFGGFGDF